MDRRKLAIDVAIAVVYLVSANPAVTGIAVHEWIGLAVLVVFFAHCVGGCDHAISIVRAGLRGPKRARVLTVALDVLLAFSIVAVAMSGLMISATVLPAFGWVAEGYFFWGPFHAFSAKVLLALLLVHVVVHGPWMARVLKEKTSAFCGDRNSK